MPDDTGRMRGDVTDPEGAETAESRVAGATAAGAAGGSTIARRVAVVVAVVLALMVLVPLVARLFVMPINPAQKTPPGHFASDCGWCHELNSSVKVTGD
jgi:hypothetical protein